VTASTFPTMDAARTIVAVVAKVAMSLCHIFLRFWGERLQINTLLRRGYRFQGSARGWAVSFCRLSETWLEVSCPLCGHFHGAKVWLAEENIVFIVLQQKRYGPN
jgi:hypothetical protein